MAYIFDLDPTIDSAFDAQGVEIAEFAVGYETDELRAYLFSITLAPLEGDVADLRFGIRHRSWTNPHEISALDYSREIVDQCIPKDRREDVRVQIREAIKILISGTHCNKITMSTYYANLPEGAMRKYDLICNALDSLGFPTEKHFRAADGFDYWLFTKNT